MDVMSGPRKPVRRLTAGECVPEWDPVRYPRGDRPVVTLRWTLPDGRQVETDEHRVVDGVVRAGRRGVPVTTEPEPEPGGVVVLEEPEAMRPVIERERTAVDDLCDRLAVEYQARAARRLPLVEYMTTLPAPDPIGWDLPDDTWRDRALCRGLDPDIFMPKPRKAGVKHRETANDGLAKRICAVCPVRDVCPFSEATRTSKERDQARRRAA